MTYNLITKKQIATIKETTTVVTKIKQVRRNIDRD